MSNLIAAARAALLHKLDSICNALQYDPSGKWGVETIGPIREAMEAIAAAEAQPARDCSTCKHQYASENRDPCAACIDGMEAGKGWPNWVAAAEAPTISWDSRGVRTVNGVPDDAAEAQPAERHTLERFNECDGPSVESPLERLRFFCSLAMSAQDWLDVEPFFDAVEAQPADERAWTLLLVGPENGLVGKFGETFPASPQHYARVNVYASPAAPPQVPPQPLTDEQIGKLDTQAIHGGPDSQYAFRFARAVERAHGIGEKP